MSKFFYDPIPNPSEYLLMMQSSESTDGERSINIFMPSPPSLMEVVNTTSPLILPVTDVIVVRGSAIQPGGCRRLNRPIILSETISSMSETCRPLATVKRQTTLSSSWLRQLVPKKRLSQTRPSYITLSPGDL